MLKKLFIGLSIVLIGIILLLQNFNIISNSFNVLDLWPVILIALGLGNIMDNHKISTGSIILLIIGVVILGGNLNLFNISIWSLILPVLIISVGISLIVSTNFKKEDVKNVNYVEGEIVKVSFGASVLDLTDVKIKDNTSIKVDVSFGALEVKVSDKCIVNTTDTKCMFAGISDEGNNSGTGKKINIMGKVNFGAIDIKRIKED